MRVPVTTFQWSSVAAPLLILALSACTITYNTVAAVDDYDGVLKGQIVVQPSGVGALVMHGSTGGITCDGSTWGTSRINPISKRAGGGQGIIDCSDGRTFKITWDQSEKNGGIGRGRDQGGKTLRLRYNVDPQKLAAYENSMASRAAMKPTLPPAVSAARPVRKPKPPAIERPRSSSGSGFFVSKLGHVVTNAHVVNQCQRVTVGENASNQIHAALVATDKRNDLALLKLGSLDLASAETKTLISKIGIKIVPLADHGLLRSKDVELGESVLVAGFPFGDIFSNTIKVTGGMVSAVRGAGDNSGQFQMDAAAQSGNSGGPIYDENGNIVGVVVAQLNKLNVAKATGSLPENVNFGIKASTVRQFLTASGLPSKWSARSKKMSTKALAKIAKKQTLMVVCHR